MRQEITQPVGPAVGTYDANCPKCGKPVTFPTYGAPSYTDKKGLEWWYADCSCGTKLKVSETYVRPIIGKLTPVADTLESILTKVKFPEVPEGTEVPPDVIFNFLEGGRK